jgi:DNA polymerase delta subunit 1
MKCLVHNEKVILEGHDEPLVFQITDLFVPEADKSKRVLSRTEVDYSKPPPEFQVVLYGSTAKGHSVCVEVNGYQPYFYLSVSDNYSKHDLCDFETYLREASYKNPTYFKKYHSECPVIGKTYKKHLVKVSLEKKKEFMGFTNGKLFKFIKITVKSLILFNRLKNFFQNPPIEFTSKYKKPFKLYESNIDPLLRFIHDTKILPCGWVSLPEKTYSVLANGYEDDSYCRTNFTVEIDYRYISPIENNTLAPLTIASFDIECTSSHGDFPVAIKDYYKLAKDLICIAQNIRYSSEDLCKWIVKAYKKDVIINDVCKIHRLYTIEPINTENVKAILETIIERVMMFMKEVKNEIEENSDEEEDENPTAKKKTAYYETAIKNVLSWKNKEKRIYCLPKLQGDAIIQIGTTVHQFGSDEIIYKHIVTLNSCDTIDGVDVESYATEKELLYAWKEAIRRIDPDMLIGYNIFGFDMPYIWERSVEILGTDNTFGIGFGRKTERECVLIEQHLSSAALGDNMLKYLDLDGIVIVDLYKLMQRNSLDSYKLDFVANLYLGENKNDIKPSEIFELYKGSAADRKVVAEYCIQDCALVNKLFHKLKVLENNTAMGNVCLVPLSYLFMRGQSIKLFSLVSSFCKNENFCIPVLKNFNENEIDEDDGYEGATVLTPNETMYLENSITVLDYSSLYPSSMIERNLSHDSYVKDPKYDNIEGVDYMTITYDIYEGTGDKKRKVSEKACKFVQFKNNEKGIIPRILMKLLTQRKNTRKKMEYETITMNSGEKFIGLVKETDGILCVTDVEKGSSWKLDVNEVLYREDTYNNFEKQVFDALQLAYKVTSNSLYGATGARVSPIYLKEIAACTTATGRERIEMAKTFVEKNYTGAEVIYGDTDSIFIKFSFYNADGSEILGKATLPLSIEMGKRVENDIKAIMPEPQALLYEKTMFPFIIFSKKRYVGLLYEDDANKKPKLKSMGIVLKRRDNAMIVKKIYGGIIDILLYKYDLNAAVDFLRTELQKLINGEYPLEDLIVTKTLKGTYKDRTKIAHATLVDRMGERGDEKPQVNDRIPYVYIDVKGEHIKLQGDRIEHPDYIREHGLMPDYQFYITNQLTKPIAQIFALCVEKLPNYSYPPSYWMQADEELRSNTIYGDNDLKRHSRIVALKQKETIALLFDEFVIKKERVSRKKVVIQKHTLSLDETPKISLSVTDMKVQKQFKGEFELTVKNTVIHVDEFFIDKKNRMSKKQAITLMMLKIMKLLENDHSELIQEKGILLNLEKSYMTTLKKALEDHEKLNENLDKAVSEADFESIYDNTEMIESFKIAKMIYRYKYMFL